MHGIGFTSNFAPQNIILKSTFRHIIVYLLTGVVFLSTTGLSVHHLYCYCKGEFTTSILKPEDPCEKLAQEAKSDCCKGGSCHQTESEKKHDCTSCTSEYVKLDVPFLLPALGFDISLPSFQLPDYFFSTTEFVESRVKITWEQDIPPPAGKELLPWIQSFLC